MLCKQTFEKWVGVKWNTALYVTHVSGHCVSVTQHWVVPMSCCCINVCSATTFWRFGNRTIPNIQKTQSGSHCGSDVSVGLAQLLPQALGQRRHGKLGAAVEMGVCAVDDAVSTHTASGRWRVYQAGRPNTKTGIFANRIFSLFTCRNDKKTAPVYVYDLTVVNIPLFHRLISFTCANARRQNVDLWDGPAERGGWVSWPWDDRLWRSSEDQITPFEALTSNMFLQPLVLPLSSDSGWPKPALLMQTSTPPCCCLIAANMDTISSSFVRSHLNGNRMPLRPSPRHSDASFWNGNKCPLFIYYLFIFPSKNPPKKHVLFQETQKCYPFNSLSSYCYKDNIAHPKEWL